MERSPVCHELARGRFEGARRLEPGAWTGSSFQVQARARHPDRTPWWDTPRLGPALGAAIAPLERSELNDLIDPPTDAALAGWIEGRLPRARLDGLSLRTGWGRGVATGAAGSRELWHRFRFEAAHRLPNVPPDHQCARMHGHGFSVVLRARAHDGGPAVTHEQLRAAWLQVAEALDYRCLNDVPGLDNPTSELLAVWIWERLEEALPTLSGVTVQETAGAGCHYRPGAHRIWITRSFEAALRDLRAPPCSGRGVVHGHSYRLRLSLTAPLERVLGWVMDFGDVKRCFGATHERLDHHRLDELNALANPDPLSILDWVRRDIAPALPEVDRLELFERPGEGASLDWGDSDPGPLDP